MPGSQGCHGNCPVLSAVLKLGEVALVLAKLSTEQFMSTSQGGMQQFNVIVVLLLDAAEGGGGGRSLRFERFSLTRLGPLGVSSNTQ
jgi:hypothetical protein